MDGSQRPDVVEDEVGDYDLRMRVVGDVDRVAACLEQELAGTGLSGPELVGPDVLRWRNPCISAAQAQAVASSFASMMCEEGMPANVVEVRRILDT